MEHMGSDIIHIVYRRAGAAISCDRLQCCKFLIKRLLPANVTAPFKAFILMKGPCPIKTRKEERKLPPDSVVKRFTREETYNQ